jgi:succinate-acetate transporter protein
MRKAISVITPRKSYTRRNSFSIIFGIFGCFWWFLDEMIFEEKGQLLAGLCPEVTQERLET